MYITAEARSTAPEIDGARSRGRRAGIGHADEHGRAPDWSGRAEITLDVTGLTDSEG